MEARPVLAIDVDLLSIAAAQDQTDRFKASLASLGPAADAAAAQVNSAMGDLAGAGQVETQQTVQQAAAATAAVVSADEERVASAIRTAQKRGFAFSQSFETEYEIVRAGYGEMSRAEEANLRSFMESQEIRATAVRDSIGARAVAERELQTAIAASARSAAAEATALTADQAKADAAALSVRRDAYAAFWQSVMAEQEAANAAMEAAQLASSRRVAAEEVALAKDRAAASVAAIQVERDAYQGWWAEQLSAQDAVRAADAATAAQAQVAADAEVAARSQAEKAYLANAEAAFALAKAEVALAATEDEATAAAVRLTEAQVALAQARAGAAGDKAMATGADAGLAANAAYASTMAVGTGGGAGATNEADAFIHKLEQMAATAGMTKAELAAYRIELLANKAANLGVADAAAPMIQKLKDTQSALGGLNGEASKAGVIREVFVMIREFSRGDFTRMAGSASILVDRMGAMGKVVAFLLSPWTLLVAAIAAFGTAAAIGSAESAKLNNALEVTSGFSGQTAASFEAATKSIGESTEQGMGKARSALLELVSSGAVSGTALTDLGDAAVRLGAVTGESSQAMAKQLEELGRDPVDALDKLNDRFHFLTLAQYEAVEALAATGDKAGATALAAKDLDDWTKTLTTNMGFLEQAAHAVAGAFGGLWQAMKDLGKQETAMQVMTQAYGLLNAARSGQSGMGNLVVGNLVLLPNGQMVSRADAEKMANLDIRNASGVIYNQRYRADQAQQQQDAITGHRELDSHDRALGGSPGAAEAEVTQYKKWVADALRKDPQDPIAVYDREHMAQRIAAINKKYDKVDQPKKAKHGPDPGAAENPIEQAQHAVDALKAQFEALNTFDLSPLADDASKINKAYSDAFSKFSNSRNPFENARAGELANLAAEKERLTLLDKMSESLLKGARADDLRTKEIVAGTAAIQNQHAALDAFYSGQSSNQGTEGYVAALQSQAKANLDLQHTQDELTIAQQFGVDKVKDIAQAYLDSLPPTMRSRQEIIAQAKALQEGAARALNMKDAVALLTDEQKAAAALADFHTKSLETIQDLNNEATAYQLGTAAIAANTRARAIQGALVGKIPASASPTERAAIVNQVTGDVDAGYSATAADNQAKLNRALEDTVRLSHESTVERQVDADIQKRINDLVLANHGVMTQAIADQAKAEALEAKRVKDAANLKIALQDQMRQTFIDTGKLDFTGLKDGLAKAMRQSIYDSLIAKPINMVINAAVNIETDLIQKAIQSALGSFGGSGTTGSGILGQITGLFGIGTNGGQHASDPGLDADLSALGPSFQKATDGLSATIGKLGQAIPGLVGGYSVGSSLATMAGVKPGLGTSIGGMLGAGVGMYFGGPIGAAIGSAAGSFLGSLFNSKPSNAGATANLDASGNLTFLGGDKSTTETQSGAQSAAQGIAQVEQALVSAGAKLGTTVSQLILGSRDPTHITFSNGQKLDTAMGDANAAIKGASTVILQGATFANSQLQSVVEKMVASAASVSDVVAKIKEFGDAQTFVGGLATAGYQYTDPLAYTLSQLAANQNTRQTQLTTYENDGVLTTDQATKAQSQLNALNTLEVNDALDKFTVTIDGSSRSMKDFTDAQQAILTFAAGLNTGALSPLSPQDQLALDKTNFSDTATKAKAGDYTSLTGLTDQAQTYLTDAQKFYGSGSAYTDIFNQVQGSLNDVGNATLPDPVTSAIQQAATDLTSAIGDSAKSIVDAINARATTTTGATPATGGTATATTRATNDNATNDNGDVVDGLAGVAATIQQAGTGQVQAIADQTAALGAKFGLGGSFLSAINGGNVGAVAMN